MDVNAVIDYAQELVSAFMQLAYSGSGSLRLLKQDKSLSVLSMECVKTLDRVFMRMNGICKTSWYLLENRLFGRAPKYDSFTVSEVFERLTEAFLSVAGESYTPEIVYKSKLPYGFPMLLDKTVFEFIIFNLLLCCLKNTPPHPEAPLKIVINTAADEKYNIFHIKDNNECLNTDVIAAAFSDDRLVPEISDDSIYCDGIIALTIKMALKSIKKLDGKLKYSALKHGNRFDIYLPNLKDTVEPCLSSPAKYMPDKGLLAQIFANATIMDELRNIAEDFRRTAGDKA